MYEKITNLEHEADCTGINLGQWESLMEGAKRADKRKINALVKRFLPEMYEGLCLDIYNPYNYYKTKTHLILVHSCIEHFLRFTTP